MTDHAPHEVCPSCRELGVMRQAPDEEGHAVYVCRCRGEEEERWVVWHAYFPRGS